MQNSIDSFTALLHFAAYCRDSMVAEGLLAQFRRDVRGTAVALVQCKGPVSDSHHLVVSLGTRCT